MSELRVLELPVKGMDCVECAQRVQRAIAGLPGVESAQVSLAAEKAVVRFDPACVDVSKICRAVEDTGYVMVDPAVNSTSAAPRQSQAFTRQVLTLLGVVFGAVLFVVVVGEQLGVFERLTARVPRGLGVVIIVAGGYPVFRGVLRAALQRRVTSHTLMTLGVAAALVVGQWATAAVVVFFMRIGDYAEKFTADRARRAVRDLTAMAPQTARVLRGGIESEVPVGDVQVGETVIVRPGEHIPVDGEVIDGQATIDQAAITGEAMPVEVGPRATVFAATIARLGSLRVRVSRVGQDTTFGRVVRLVEEAEANRADVQRIADRFSAYYLPVVSGIAALTLLIRRDPLATSAVLVVACSCSFALATPVAILASVGAAAKRGVLIKGGKYLEALAGADVLLIDKTGTVTLGRPRITDIIALNGASEHELLVLAASADRYSEHPLAEAVRTAAGDRGVPLGDPREFQAVPGIGARATVNGHRVAIGSPRVIQSGASTPVVGRLEAEGKTALCVSRDDELIGVLAASDTLRPEVPDALAEVRALGITEIELLTGDNERAAVALAHSLGVRHRAELMPGDKIGVVKAYQARGHRVVMVGDGVNDAPALAQADVGIAMGAAGTDVAIEAAHIVLMRDDWALVPGVLHIARRTMAVVKLNIGFTALYNLAGLGLAALGFLPPIFAAAAQSLPDIGILANSARLLRQGTSPARRM